MASEPLRIKAASTEKDKKFKEDLSDQLSKMNKRLEEKVGIDTGETHGCPATSARNVRMCVVRRTIKK